MSFAGNWRITEMDLWDQAAVDLVGPAFIEFGGHGGHFRFIAVEGWMDCRHKERNGRPYVDFTWDGNDECDPARGRGWAKLENDGSLTGHIYFHHGDDSSFKAMPFEENEKPAPKASPSRSEACDDAEAWRLDERDRAPDRIGTRAGTLHIPQRPLGTRELERLVPPAREAALGRTAAEKG